MENQPNKNEGNQKHENTFGHDADRENSLKRPFNAKEDSSPEFDDIDNTDKYLAMEQQGVTFTPENDPTINSDQADFGSESRKKEWSDKGGNSKYSDAFNQDDYLLNDNLDLDEDQNRSISSDDDDFEETNERY